MLMAMSTFSSLSVCHQCFLPLPCQHSLERNHGLGAMASRPALAVLSSCPRSWGHVPLNIRLWRSAIYTFAGNFASLALLHWRPISAAVSS
jgi:hypothetical protein